MRKVLEDLGIPLPALDINVIELLANVVLLTMAVTFAFGIVAYVAYKLRDRRRAAAKARPEGRSGDTIFFTRYVPNSADFPAEAQAVDDEAAQALAVGLRK